MLHPYKEYHQNSLKRHLSEAEFMLREYYSSKKNNKKIGQEKDEILYTIQSAVDQKENFKNDPQFYELLKKIEKIVKANENEKDKAV